MPYEYEILRSTLFSDEGQRKFITVRDNVWALLKRAGAVRMQEAISCVSGGVWEEMACIDRMVELGELRELTSSGCPGQGRVFVSAKVGA